MKTAIKNSDVISKKVTEGGRVVLPAELRKEFNIKVGETVHLESSPAGIVISTPEMALRRLQKKWQSVVPKDVSVVDEFIADRRRKAANE